MQMDNELQTVIYMIVTEIFITVGLFALYMGLKWMNTIKWESGLYQWLSLFFPISQFTIGIYTAGKWLANRMLMPTMSIVGLCVGLVADIYMIMIFLRSNSRRIAEKNLEQINQKYELEQMRYEQLKENQEEVSKIRHDFQNYILTVKNMK